MRNFVLCSWNIVFLSLVLISCIPGEPEPEPTPELKNPDLLSSTGDELVKEWMAMAEDPASFRGAFRTFELIDTLNSQGDTALNPIIQKLADPEASAEAKVFVLQCVNINMTPAYIPILKPLMEDTYPADTRACATQLLGAIESEKVVPLLKDALKDESPNVVFTAQSGLAVQNVDDYRTEFLGLYHQEDTNVNQKAEIRRVIMYSPSPDGITDQEFGILANEIFEKDTPLGVRSAIAMLLLESGRPQAIETIQKSLELSDNNSYKQLVQSALDKRNEASVTN
jgi:HEAT repeat protein